MELHRGRLHAQKVYGFYFVSFELLKSEVLNSLSDRVLMFHSD